MTKTVPDISPLMPMHQDPLLVSWMVTFYMYVPSIEIMQCYKIQKLSWFLSVFSTEVCFIVNTLRPRQNGRHFPHDISKCIFLNENVSVAIAILLKFVPTVPIDNKATLFHIMAWRRIAHTNLLWQIMGTFVSIFRYLHFRRTCVITTFNNNLV